MSRGTICSLKNILKSFESFRIFCRNLWHGSQKSIYVSRVKIAGKNSFFLFSFRNFFDFWAKFFQTFGQKTSRKSENYLLRVHRNNLWLYIFLKSFEPFWIFYRKLWHGSQNSIYVSRVKISEETVFLFFFSEFFSDFERKFFSDFRPKNFMKFSKIPSTCPEEQFVDWNFFSKVLNRFGFSAETFGMVLKSLSTCPE